MMRRVAIVFVVMVAARVAGAAQLNVPSPPAVIVRDLAARQSFLLYSDVDLPGARVIAESGRVPDGQAFAPDVSFNVAGGVVKAGGTPVDFSLAQATQFGADGEYQLNLLVTAPGATELRTKLTLTLKRTVPDCDGLKDAVLSFTKPVCGDPGPYLVPVTLPPGATVSGEALATRADHHLAHARLVAARRDGAVELRLADVDEVGTFAGAVVVRGPQLAPEGVRLPVVVTVTGSPLYAILALLFGVLLALGVQLLTGRWLPREENRRRGFELRGELEAWLDAGPAPDKRGQLQALDEAISTALQQNLSDTTGAKLKLDDVAAKLAALQAAEVAQRNAEWQRLATLAPQLDALPDAARAPLDALRADATRLLERKQTDEARRAIDKLVAALPAAPPTGARFAREEDAAAPPAPAASIAVSADPSSDHPVRLEVTVSGAPAPTRVDWILDGKSRDQRGSVLGERLAAGDHEVSVAVTAGGAAPLRATRRFAVRLGDNARALDSARHRIVRANLAMTAIAVGVAVASGMLGLYCGKIFGTTPDYIAAVLWGFGADASVRGIRDVMVKLGVQA
jgi:hypothetical protein